MVSNSQQDEPSIKDICLDVTRLVLLLLFLLLVYAFLPFLELLILV